MIVHALFRNLLIPSTLSLYLYYEYTHSSLVMRFYRYLSYATFYAIPAYTLCALTGFNPLSWVVTLGWRSPQTPIQYLLYINLAKHLSYTRTRRFVYSYVSAIVSAGAVGYLYEVPYWLLNGYGLLRTAKNSFIILDWGMLCVPILCYMLHVNGLKPKKRISTQP